MARMRYGEDMTTTNLTNDPWASDPEYPVSDWQYEVASGDTRNGYAAWIAVQRDTLTPERQALELVMEFGARLAPKPEWDLDDNFDTTEALYALYCEITGHGS